MSAAFALSPAHASAASRSNLTPTKFMAPSKNTVKVCWLLGWFGFGALLRLRSDASAVAAAQRTVVVPVQMDRFIPNRTASNMDSYAVSPKFRDTENMAVASPVKVRAGARRGHRGVAAMTVGSRASGVGEAIGAHPSRGTLH